MNTLNLKILGAGKINPTINIDGKSVKFKKNEFGSYSTNFTTEKEQVEIVIYKYLEINGKLWFLMSILFFIISLFGLLDTRYDRKCVVVDCKFLVNLQEKTEMTIKVNSLTNEGKAVECTCNTEFQEISNQYYVDKRAKKRLKILLAVKIILWLALMGTVIALVATRS